MRTLTAVVGILLMLPVLLLVAIGLGPAALMIVALAGTALLVVAVGGAVMRFARDTRVPPAHG